MKRLGLLLALPCALLLLPGIATATPSGSIVCNSIRGGTLHGNVVVPNGDLCSLSGATVTGGVTVQQGGGLVIIDGSMITGSVLSVSGPAADFQAANTFGNGYPSYNGSIWICGSTVQGLVDVAGALNQVTVGAPSSGRFNDQFNHCPGSTIGGSIITSGVQGGVEVVDSSIGGSVQISRTVGCPNDEEGCNDGHPVTPKTVEVTGNTIHGSLLCSSSQNGVDVHDNSVSYSSCH